MVKYISVLDFEAKAGSPCCAKAFINHSANGVHLRQICAHRNQAKLYQKLA